MRQTILPLILVVLPACTTVDFESPRFAVETEQHTSIAVLPFEVVLTGTPPRDLTSEQVAMIEEAESVAFQAAYYNRLLNRSSAQQKRPILVTIQPVGVTNRILESTGVGIRESWRMSPQSLARALEVDAVVKTTVHKTRYLSNGASYGVDVALHVINDVTEGRLPLFVPPGLARTHDIYADSVLFDGADGSLLWRVAVNRETDWSRPANDVVAGITKKLARKFPYRG